ncbi:hypothetical protein Tco_1427465 [Tanacetum coccineum]
MSPSNHPIIVPSDSDIKDAFSSTNVPDYFLATPRNTSPDSSNDLTNPPQVTIPPPAILPTSLVLSLSPMFDSQDFFPPKEIPPPKDTKNPVESPIPISPSSSVGSSSPVRSITPPPDYPFDKSIFAELDNSLWIIPRPLGSEPMPPKKTSTSAAPAITQAAIRQLVADSVAATLEA